MPKLKTTVVVALALIGPVAGVAAHPCLCNGDANLDGTFDQSDFQYTIDCIGQLPFNECVNADINCDGFINEDDIDPADPFGGSSTILCLWGGLTPDECCPGHVACGSPLAGDCFEANGNAACNDLDCCILVCLSDPFCCDSNWDQFCDSFARSHCERPGDCNADAAVDLDDFIAFAGCAEASANTPVPEECACADFDNDGDTDTLDYAAFQRAFAAE